MGYVSSLKSADNVTNDFYICKYCWKRRWGKQKFDQTRNLVKL